jgi:hypothetical protein
MKYQNLSALAVLSILHTNLEKLYLNMRDSMKVVRGIVQKGDGVLCGRVAEAIVVQAHWHSISAYDE